MDAWRFRGEPGGAFDRFWRSTIAGLAIEARPAVDVRLTPRRASPGQRVQVTARVRTLERERLGDRLAIARARRCGSRSVVARRSGRFVQRQLRRGSQGARVVDAGDGERERDNQRPRATDDRCECEGRRRPAARVTGASPRRSRRRSESDRRARTPPSRRRACDARAAGAPPHAVCVVDGPIRSMPLLGVVAEAPGRTSVIPTNGAVETSVLSMSYHWKTCPGACF